MGMVFPLSFSIDVAWAPDNPHKVIRSNRLVSFDTFSESPCQVTQCLTPMPMEQIYARFGITAEEMKLAKESIINGYVFNYDTPSKLVNARALLEDRR